MRPRTVCTCAERRIRIGTVDKWTATKVSEGPSMCWGVLLIHVLLITIRLIMLISWQERTQILMAVSWLISCELYFLQHDSRYQLRCRPSITPVNWLGCLCTPACLPDCLLFRITMLLFTNSQYTCTLLSSKKFLERVYRYKEKIINGAKLYRLAISGWILGLVSLC